MGLDLFKKKETIEAVGTAGSKLLDAADQFGQGIRSMITGEIKPDDAVDLLKDLITFETGLVKAKAEIIKAEATSQSWLTRTWRPITMLTLLALIVLNSYGLLPNELSVEAWGVIKFGLGGYVVGRSAEAVVNRIKP